MENDKKITIEFFNYILLDAVRALTVEYSMTTDFLINVAVKRLLEDIEALRLLRNNNYVL